MKGLLENFGVAVCGLVTSILVAIIHVALAKMTGLDLFTFSIWFVFPAGALVTGFAAASGYYFGSLYFHKRATATLLIQMVAIAGLTQLLIYWLGYVTMVFDDGTKVADFIPFGQYMDLILTKAHYSIVRSQVDTGEVGSMGYWIAGGQFVGFLVGGLSIFAYLTSKPVCAACKLYLRPIAEKQKLFADANAASVYYDTLPTLAENGPDFAALISSVSKIEKVSQGSVQVDTSLLGCPECKGQMIVEKVKVFSGKEWKDVNDLDRQISLPSGTDLASVFRG